MKDARPPVGSFPAIVASRPAVGDHLGIGGTATTPGSLIFVHGENPPVVGQTTLKRWSWNHLLMTRRGDKVQVFLNGAKQPEIETTAAAAGVSQVGELFIGGRSDNDANFEGRIDEVAVFDRALSEAERASLLVKPIE